MKMRILLILLCIWAFSPAGAQSTKTVPGLEAVLDRQTAKVGEQVVLRLKYSLPEGAALENPPEVKGVEDLTLADVQKGQGEVRLSFLVDRLKDWKTKELTLVYRDKDGKLAELKTDPVSLTVASNLGEKPAEAELRPIYDIMPVRSWWQVHLAWIVGGFALLLLGGGVLWWLRRRAAIKDVTATIAFPHVRAREAIEALEREGLFEKGQVKAFYFRTSEILRQYLEALRRFPAPELTTEEIASRLTAEADRKAVSLLRQADLVKFADLVPTLARKEEEVREMLAYIEGTAGVFEPQRAVASAGGRPA